MSQLPFPLPGHVYTTMSPKFLFHNTLGNPWHKHGTMCELAIWHDDRVCLVSTCETLGATNYILYSLLREFNLCLLVMSSTILQQYFHLDNIYLGGDHDVLAGVQLLEASQIHGPVQQGNHVWVKCLPVRVLKMVLLALQPLVSAWFLM